MSLDEQNIRSIILALGGVTKVTDETDNIEFYSVKTDETEKKFAIFEFTRRPLRLSLRVSRVISETLRAEYESVMTGVNLNPDKWVSLVLSGQIDDDKVKDLIVHAYHEAQLN